MLTEEFVRTTNRVEAVTQSFLEQPQQNSYQSLIMLAIIAAALLLAGGLYALYLRQTGRIFDDPKRLFRELCRAHGLSLGQQSILMKLVKARKLQNPNLVMLDANLWVLDPTTDVELCTPKMRSRLIHVQRLLFSSENR